LLIFLIIGGANTIVSYFISFALATWGNWSLFPSTALSYALCSVPSFYFNLKFSFKSNAPLAKSIFRFTIIITVCFFLSYGLNNIVMPFLRNNLLASLSDIWYTLIRLLGIQVVFTILNYIGQRLWAFNKSTMSENVDSAQNSNNV
jgi:putative flippase GtrA